MRIHFLCDHKWRDLPNITAIKVALEQRGHRVLVSTTKDAWALAKVFRPDAMVFNHLFSSVYRKMAQALRADGRAVIVLPTEGAMRPEYEPIGAGEFTDYSAVNLFLAWSQATADSIRRRWGFGDDVVPVAGCSRFDFHHERFRPLVSTRETFCQQNNLDSGRPIVTWATAYGYAHLHGNESPAVKAQFERESGEVGVAECLRRIGIPLHDMPRMFAESREKCASSFFKLARAMPDAQFVVKPHPVENREFYRSYIRENNLKNVRFCPDDYIWNIIRATDIHLHRQCTTAVEAWMWGKPTVEMGMDDHPAWAWAEREAGSYTAHDADELIELVRSRLGQAIDASMCAYRRGYIEQWFGSADGRRCEANAELIDATMRARPARMWLRPLKGLPLSPRDQLRSALGYVLDKTPGQSLFRPREAVVPRGGMGSEDRHIRYSDVRRYARRLACVIGSP